MRATALLAGAAAVGLAVVGASALWLRRGSAPPAPAPATTDNQVAAMQDELTRLRRDVKLLEANARVPAAAAPGAPAAGAATAAAAAPTAPLTAEERKARIKAALQQWYGNIDSRLASEGTDPGWSPTATQAAQELIAKHASAKLGSAQCGRSMCKIVVTHDDKDMQRAFASEISEDEVLDTEVAYKYEPDATPPSTTMWVARKGHKLPRARQQ